MPRVDLLYEMLARDLRTEAVDVLAAALPDADAAYGARIAAILVERRHEHAWAALAGSYTQLPPPVRVRLLTKVEQIAEGLAGALSSTAPAQRASALSLLAEAPHPELTYRAAECLIDTDESVRGAAGAALVALATFGLDQPANVRVQIGSGLREAVRAFERHRDQAVLRACLWYAREIGPELWKSVSGMSVTGRVVEQRLHEWADGRLAAFLILGVADAGWRRSVEEILNRWESFECGVALVNNSDLLSRRGVRRAMVQVRTPRWLMTLTTRAQELTPAQRSALPQWVACLGLDETDRWRWLNAWTSHAPPDLQLSAAHALASLGSHERALQSLSRLARETDGPAARFARWYLAGRQVARQRAEAMVRRGAGAAASTGVSHG